MISFLSFIRTRDRVLKNTAKIKSAESDHNTSNTHQLGEDTESGSNDFRDQGFSRPKVLILLPFKNNAFEVIKMLMALSGSSQQVSTDKIK